MGVVGVTVRGEKERAGRLIFMVALTFPPVVVFLGSVFLFCLNQNPFSCKEALIIILFYYYLARVGKETKDN